MNVSVSPDIRRAARAFVAFLSVGSARAPRVKLLILIGAAALILWAPTVSATIIGFSSRQSTAYGIPGHGLAPGQALPSTWGWNYTGNSSDTQRTVFHANYGNHLCIGPNGVCGSNNNDGIPGNEYAGYEFLYYSFDLPGDAANVELFFNFVAADDRLVVRLNNNFLGAFGGSGTNNTLVTTHRDGTGTHTFTFSSPYGSNLLFDNAGLFNLGGTNTLAFWINNTNSLYVTAPAHSHYSLGDPSALNTVGYVSFGTAVPEPGSIALLASGLLAIATARRRRSPVRPQR